MDSRLTGWMQTFFPPLLATASALVVVTLGLWLSDTSPLMVLSAFFAGAVGDTYRCTESLVKACPLVYTGLAVTLALHAGVWNIGAEGQFLLGALAAVGGGRYLGSLPSFLAIPLVCSSAMLAGGLWAALAAYLKTQRGVNEVISTIMLNFIAASLISYSVHGPLKESAGQYPQTDPVPPATRLPHLLPPTRLHLGVPLTLLGTLGVGCILFRTTTGFRLRATGANPIAAHLAGIAVAREINRAFVLSGALAGLAGAIEVTGVTLRLYERFSPGYGYSAIVVALVGQKSPAGVLLAALFFGALEAGSGTMQRVAGVSSVLVALIQATIVFFLAAYSTDTVQRLLSRASLSRQKP